MDCMYHWVPYQMVGTILYPLNRLKDIDEAAYKREALKYQEDRRRGRLDRTRLMRSRIPKLDCLWNDVIHSSSVHPQRLMDMWVSEGYRPQRSLHMFEIPIAQLDESSLIIYRFTDPILTRAPWQFVRYKPEQYGDYTEVSEQARRAIREGVKENDVWHFLHIPHVMYRGSIETEGLKVITVQVP